MTHHRLRALPGSRALTVSTALALALVSTPAFAWRTTNYYWTPDQLPIVFHSASLAIPAASNADAIAACNEGYETEACPKEDSDLETEGDQPWSGISPDVRAQVIQDSFDEWHKATCADIDWEYGGYSVNNGWKNDGKVTISYDDTADQLDSSGTLAATLHIGSLNRDFRRTIATPHGPETIFGATEVDIVFQKDETVRFGTDDVVGDRASCAQRTSFQSVATHEIGHLLGLGHSIESFEESTVTTPVLQDATMFWSVGPCNTAPSDINADDIAGLTAIYGPSANFECSNQKNPGDPATRSTLILPAADLSCSVNTEYSDHLQKVTWTWGDGTEPTEWTRDAGASGPENWASLQEAGEHSYSREGLYTVKVCFFGDSDDCGPWSGDEQTPVCTERTSMVRVCDIPQAAFTWETLEGVRLQLLNDTPLLVEGCASDVQWDIYDESNTLVESIQTWEPDVTFPSPGTYRVVLNVGGPAGISAAEATIDVKRTGVGCDTTGAAGLLAIAAAGLLVRRRR